MFYMLYFVYSVHLLYVIGLLHIACIIHLAYAVEFIERLSYSCKKIDLALSTTYLFYTAAAEGLATNYTYYIVYRWILYIGILYVIPLTILIFTSVALILTLCHRRKWLCSLQAEPRSVICTQQSATTYESWIDNHAALECFTYR